MSQQNPLPGNQAIPGSPEGATGKVLKELKDMYDAGLISEQEFGARKAEVLSRMVDSNASAATQRSGVATKVQVLGILMIVQGSLEALLGIPIALIGPLAMMDEASFQSSGEQTIAIGTMLCLGLAILVAGGLLIYGGIRTLKYRNRTLGIVALILGTLTGVPLVYCAPTAIGLVIYGLIVYLDVNVRQAFELAEQSAAPV